MKHKGLMTILALAATLLGWRALAQTIDTSRSSGGGLCHFHCFRDGGLSRRVRWGTR